MMNGRVKTGRNSFLDVLRVWATAAVVLLHCITGVMDTTDMSAYPLEKTFFLVVMDLITWCVPIFVMISGYLFLNPAKEITFHRMLLKYCRRIVLALFIFGVPYACMELLLIEGVFTRETVWRAIEMIVHGDGWSHMWYLYMILVLYFLTPVLKWILKKLSDGAVYLILAFLLVGSSVLTYIGKLLQVDMIPHLPDAGIYFFYYICGYVIVKKKMKLGEKSRHVLSVAIGIICVGMIVSRLIGDYSVQMAYNYPFTVLLSIMLFVLVQSWGAHFGKNAKKWEKAGELCFAIYLVHPVYVNILYKCLHVTPLSFSIYLSLPIFFVIVLLLATITAWVLHQIPGMKRYVL